MDINQSNGNTSFFQSPNVVHAAVELIGGSVHPSESFLENIQPVDRRVCLAKHYDYCNKTKRQIEVVSIGSGVKKRSRKKRNCNRDIAALTQVHPRQDSSPDKEQISNIVSALNPQCIDEECIFASCSNELITIKEDPILKLSDTTESIDEIITSLICNNTNLEEHTTTNILPKLTTNSGSHTGYLSVYHKFINHYEYTYNEHDPNRFLQFLRSSCFKQNLIRHRYIWDKPYHTHKTLSSAMMDPEMCLIRHLPSHGIDHYHYGVNNTFEKLPDCIVITHDTRIKYLSDKQITITKSSFHYFFTILLNKLIPLPITSESLHYDDNTMVNIELTGCDMFVFNSEGCIINIYDHLIMNYSSNSLVTFEHIMQYLGL